MCFTGIDYITGENFLDMLDNGVVVCHLAQVIQDRAKQVVDVGSVKGVSCTDTGISLNGTGTTGCRACKNCVPFYYLFFTFFN